MKRADVLAAIADLAGGNEALRLAAARKLEALPQGYFDDHPLPKTKVAPHLLRLIELLHSDCPDAVKEWSAQIIGESRVRSDEILQALLAALNSKSGSVLITTLWAVGGFRDKASPAVDALFRLTTHPNREVRWRAVWALREITPKGAQFAERFTALFDDADPTVRGYAVLAFVASTSKSEWAAQQLRRLVDDPDSMPRLHARRTLEQWERS